MDCGCQFHAIPPWKAATEVASKEWSSEGRPASAVCTHAGTVNASQPARRACRHCFATAGGRSAGCQSRPAGLSESAGSREEQRCFLAKHHPRRQRLPCPGSQHRDVEELVCRSALVRNGGTCCQGAGRAGRASRPRQRLLHPQRAGPCQARHLRGTHCGRNLLEQAAAGTPQSTGYPSALVFHTTS